MRHVLFCAHLCLESVHAGPGDPTRGDGAPQVWGQGKAGSQAAAEDSTPHKLWEPRMYTGNNGGHVGSQADHQGPNSALSQFFYSDPLFIDVSQEPGTQFGHLTPGWAGGRSAAPPEATKWVTVSLVPFLRPLCPPVLVVVRWVGGDGASRSPWRGAL